MNINCKKVLLLNENVDKHNYSLNRIHNVDESGLTGTQRKILGVTGHRAKRGKASLTSDKSEALTDYI